MSEVISLFRSLRAGSQVFALLMLFICVILHTMFSYGLSAINMMFEKIMLAVCILVGMLV